MYSKEQSELKILNVELKCNSATNSNLLILKYAVDKELDARGMLQ